MDISPLFTGIIGFVVGFGAGYLVKAYTVQISQKDKSLHAEDIVMGAIAVAWFVSVLASIMIPEAYSTPLEVHAIMGLLAGYLYKTRAQRENGGSSG